MLQNQPRKIDGIQVKITLPKPLVTEFSVSDAKLGTVFHSKYRPDDVYIVGIGGVFALSNPQVFNAKSFDSRLYEPLPSGTTISFDVI